ncbi:NAD(P)H-binding protein [Mycolicibacterium pyrenivorans]|uniref:NAD(P)H-binding protein n=1 Tax=Mycolicibacterium pyrenivorans TaxID=187102 RepID=UPI0021F27ECF|nr:NAD(P)H-binding protein [Mycolicibacterium pyrenivorans]MCV7151661.1 NAD(P)H-binding protein [Mycolicibacterium pyrenivorans]
MNTRYLVTGAGGTIGGVSNAVVDLLVRDGAQVRALVHRDDHRADPLRRLGAQVVAGDLTEPTDVVAAMHGVDRVFFNMGVSASYLEAAAVVSAVGREHDGLETIVNMSQMTVSQMSLTSRDESHQQRLHWLSEQVMDWSGLPVTHVRPTVFMDNPLFTFLSALLDVDGLARNLAGALGHPVAGADIPHTQWAEQILEPAGLPPHVAHHIDTMARLHRAHRYERLTDDVERVTGRPAVTMQQYVAENAAKFGG